MALHPRGRHDYLRSMPGAFWSLFAIVLAFVAILMIFEFVGVPKIVIAFLFVFVPLAGYALIGIASRTLQIVEYFVAGRRVPAVFNGMAAAANWVGATMVLGLGGSLVFMGFDGLAYLIGWTGGFVLAAVLFAPYLRKYGAFTVPDFLAARFGGAGVRLCGVLVLMASAAALMTAEFHAGGLIISQMLGTDFDTGVIVTLVAVLFCIVWGGIRGATWTQGAQFIVLGTAIIVPVTLITMKHTGNPLAPASLGGLLEQLGTLEERHEVGVIDILPATGGFRAFVNPHIETFANFSPAEFSAVALCMMLGAASMPHMLMRFFTATDVHDARRAAGWSVLFVVIVFLFLPVAAVVVKIDIFANVIGQQMADLPGWVEGWADRGLVLASDANGDGRLGVEEFFMAPDAVLLVLPEVGGLPFVLTALLAAGILGAAVSTASGLVLVTSNGLSHDLYYRLVQPSASTAKRLVIARLVLIAVAGGAAWAAIHWPMEILPLVAWSLSLAAAGNFAVLVLATWWKRCTRWGAIAGMVSGFFVTLSYLVGQRFLDWEQILGAEDFTAGLLGVPVSFAFAIAVSLMTRVPSGDVRKFVNDIRNPQGRSFMERERAAERIREAGAVR